MGSSISKQPTDKGLGLHKFGLLRVIGRGSFGKVRIVEHKESRKTYALKYISKADSIRNKAHLNIIRERDILEEIDHPFVVNLRFSFQDDFDMFMVMDLMMGGDLRFHMQRRRFVEGVIRFWVAEIASAINYLHTTHNVVHRDIKPDNILMDDRGHVALTDFNIATRIQDGRKHYSVAGTANYMAPELVSGHGYTYSVDWWSLGVVMYECVYGKRPFRHGKSSDDLKRAIQNDEVQFPIIADVRISFECISAMRGFLEKDPKKRLGSSGYEALKQHAFFSGIDWDKLECRQLEPAFVPDSEQSNFDITHDIEEMLLEQEPLTARTKRGAKLKPVSGAQRTHEYDVIDRDFTNFDYIEYEQFKHYIDSHGEINSAAADAARAAGPPKQQPTMLANILPAVSVPLSQLKLDGRTLINFARFNTATANGSSSSARKSMASRSDSDYTASRNTQQLAKGQVRPKTAQVMGAPMNNSSSSTLSVSSSSNDLMPPSIVPVDKVTWQMMLPEQRQLAHRFCIKMVHDRQRNKKIREAMMAANASPTIGHGVVKDVDAESASSSQKNVPLLTVAEKRRSIMKRQKSFGTFGGISTEFMPKSPPMAQQQLPPQMLHNGSNPASVLPPGYPPHRRMSRSIDSAPRGTDLAPRLGMGTTSDDQCDSPVFANFNESTTVITPSYHNHQPGGALHDSPPPPPPMLPPRLPELGHGLQPLSHSLQSMGYCGLPDSSLGNAPQQPLPPIPNGQQQKRSPFRFVPTHRPMQSVGGTGGMRGNMGFPQLRKSSAVPADEFYAHGRKIKPSLTIADVGPSNVSSVRQYRDPTGSTPRSHADSTTFPSSLLG